MAKKKGRPQFPYNEELANEICGTIASSSVGLATLCGNNPHWPSRDTIYQWRENNPSFSDKYARAKIYQGEFLADEIIEIADDTSRDTMVNEEGITVFNNTAVARDRLRIDSRKWDASKLAPKIFGSHKSNDILIELKNKPDEKLVITKVTDPIEAARIYEEFMRNT
jgi:hypothetical protein